MLISSVTSRDDKVHEDFIKKCKAEGANLILQIDHDNNNAITIIDIRSGKDVK